MDEVSRGVLGICPGRWSFKCLSRGARRYNRSLSRDPGGDDKHVQGRLNKIEACPGGHL